MKKSAVILICFALWLSKNFFAQQRIKSKSNQDKQSIIDKKLFNQTNPVLATADSLLKSYIIEGKSLKMWETLTLNFRNGCYKKFSHGDDLAFQLNQKLFKIS